MTIRSLATPVSSTLEGAAVAYQYREPYRPQLSYSPRLNWMNDPNGLVYHDGEYHLFYQYNPNDTVWGDMSWGHAVSPDLVHWSELPVALTVEKDRDGTITQSFFSGSAVVDSSNSSGLGTPDQAAMIIMYTSVYPSAMTLANGRRVQAGQQSQSIAFSVDHGRSWMQYPDNPVLVSPPAGYLDEYRDFRDPKVFWYAPQKKWIMVVALAHRHIALLYTSRNLIDWDYMSEFGPAGAVGGVWECPDLFELSIDGDAARSKWVMVINLNPGGPAGGSGAQYFIGQFDGRTFQADTPAVRLQDAFTAPPDAAVVMTQPGERVSWLDHGPDFYAAITWNNAPDGKRFMMGWMNNWQYANKIPTAPWRSAQSFVRALELRTIEGEVCLVQRPIAGLERLRRQMLHAADVQQIDAATTHQTRIHTEGAPVEIEMVLHMGTAVCAGLKVHVGVSGEQTLIGYDTNRGEIFIDRCRAGQASFHPQFAARHAAPVALCRGAIRLRILVDTASVTVFAGEQGITLTSQVFPGAHSDGIAWFAVGGQAEASEFRIWSLTSIWSSDISVTI